MNRKDSTIIRYLIEHREQELNILTISRALRMDYKNVYSIVKRLEKESLIRIEHFGRSNRIQLVQKINSILFEAEYKRREKMLKNRNLMVMLNQFKDSITSKCYILLLFGSYAKKKQVKSSDIDLMFIAPEGIEEKLEKEVNRAAGLLPLNLHCMVFSEKQFIDMLHSRERNVCKEAAEHNVILYGIESYYEMIT